MRQSMQAIGLAFVLMSIPVMALGAGADASSETPRRGGTLRLAYISDWRSLDPAISFDTESSPLQKLLFRGLIDFDDGVNLVPDQASDWNISPDGKIYTFHLRPGVRFSNGREVEAEDYVFTIERLLDAKTGAVTQTYFTDILGAEAFRDGKAAHVVGLRAPDRRTFTIELKEPKFTFRYVLALASASVLPRDIVQQYGDDFQLHLVGTGPYRIAEWRRGIRYRLERNPYYSGSDGHVDAIEIMIGGDTTLHGMMLERGELDRCNASRAEVIRFERDPRLRPLLQYVGTASTDYFFMNVEIKPFDDVRVRQALCHAINVDRLVKLNRGFGVAARGIVPPSMPWSNPDLKGWAYDPAKAIEMLRDAGYPNGFKTELWYPAGNPLYTPLAAGVQQELKKVGVEAEVRAANSEAFLVKSGTRGQTPCGISGWYEDYPDPSDYLDVLFNGQRITDTDCNNLSFYSSKTVDLLLNQADESMDSTRRTQLFRETERKIMQDAPWMPLMHEQLPKLNSRRLRGTRPHPVWLWRYERFWLSE